ncbi:hypothetical protein H6F93_27190 [Leptolyngbya sp. FACHB-671]|uniref:FAD-binding domain-containing protein n=1 Tax=Leptolyngbya sp. FACHB-671 TaxID=2692812 RepID=UPI001687F603|nr:FAD-binding domain-containing protein [Leptolyngbya sp. FACHB-671]MBD1870083.1 hypothetical protein [Cyanobacteria bacterium FACHB-471]MBD2071156.1 hypothetical protein [Leptolyngbya sp. FACHB-671]
MDWRFGALHFMHHLIDGDCPIDHYQWAMQAGVTHCVDKTWTRIYNSEQVTVDRCDPEGAFIKQWVPELAKLPAAALGSPLGIKGYPAPILKYKAARQRRVQQLQQQRQIFMNQENVIPHLARLPKSVIPFGAERFNSEIGWAKLPDIDMFPLPLDLDALDIEGAIALRTWFVAHVEIKPHQSKRRSKKSKTSDGVTQLSLLP